MRRRREQNEGGGESNPFRSHACIYLGGTLLNVLGLDDGAGGGEGGGGGGAEINELELRHGWLDR